MMEPRSLRRPGLPPVHKRHTTERFKHPMFLIERWTNAKSAYVGYLWGIGRNSGEIERTLDDGTSGPTIRALISRRWKLPKDRPRGVIVGLNPYCVGKLSKLAEKRNMTPEEWASKVLHAAVKDDLYAAIVDE